MATDWAVLNELFSVIEGRKGGDPDSSHTARLFSKGTEKIAQKVGEEAVEAVIGAMKGDRENLTAESADLLYHLMVLWADQGVRPEDVVDTLAGRMGISGIAEKQARPQD